MHLSGPCQPRPRSSVQKVSSIHAYSAPRETALIRVTPCHGCNKHVYYQNFFAFLSGWATLNRCNDGWLVSDSKRTSTGVDGRRSLSRRMMGVLTNLFLRASNEIWASDPSDERSPSLLNRNPLKPIRSRSAMEFRRCSPPEPIRSGSGSWACWV